LVLLRVMFEVVDVGCCDDVVDAEPPDPVVDVGVCDEVVDVEAGEVVVDVEDGVAVADVEDGVAFVDVEDVEDGVAVVDVVVVDLWGWSVVVVDVGGCDVVPDEVVVLVAKSDGVTLGRECSLVNTLVGVCDDRPDAEDRPVEWSDTARSRPASAALPVMSPPQPTKSASPARPAARTVSPERATT
jgi:hypothetical protein